MTDKELIQAYRECMERGSGCGGCPWRNVPSRCAIEIFDADDIITRLEALIAENEHLREAAKMEPLPSTEEVE